MNWYNQVMPKKALLCFLSVVFLLSAFLLLLPDIFNTYAKNPDPQKERLIVRFKPQAGMTDKLNIKKLVAALLSDKIDKFNAEVFEIPAGDSENIIKTLKKQNLVLYAEIDEIVEAFETTNDPYLANQWGLTKIKAASTGESAWNYNKGNTAVSVAIIDTGIDQNHPDLIGKIAKNKNCTSSGTVDDLYGHGTHVAGIAAASTNNGSGIAGTGYNVRLINAKALADNGSGYHSWIANCIIWSSDNGAAVINLSLGGSGTTQTLSDAVNYAVNKGVVVVAAAGNSNSSSPSYPAYYPNVIAVAATDSNDQKASFSNYGSWVDIAAPGVSIYSTAPNHANSLKINNYAYLSGTSMATPFVSGLSALLKSAGNLNGIEIRDNLFQNADKIAQTGNYWVNGRINALNSIKAVAAFSPSLVPLSTLSPTRTPTKTPIPTPTITPSLSPSPNPSPTGLGPTPTPWWCRYLPSRC